jgi:hypothetical protein
MLLGLAVFVVPAESAYALSPVDCATVDMDYADRTATKRCETGDASSGLFRATEQVLVVDGHGYYIYARRLKAGYRSYVTPEAIGDFADDFIKALLQVSGPIKAHGTVSGYDIATFSGKLAEDPHPDVDCFVFSRYGGVINAPGGFSGAPGFAHGLGGGYCTRHAAGVPDLEIQHIMVGLRAPVDGALPGTSIDADD